MSARYEIRPGEARKSRYATHSEVLQALQKTAKHHGTVAKVPTGKRGDRWKAMIGGTSRTSDGLTIAGDIKRDDDHTLELFHVIGPCDHAMLMTFAEHIATIAGKQAVIGETDDEFWFVEKPAPKSKTKSAKRR